MGLKGFVYGCVSACMPIIIGAGGFTSIDYLLKNDKSYVRQDGVSVKEDWDGFSAHTEFEIRGNNIDVTRYGGFFGDYMNYRSEGLSGRVDVLDGDLPNKVGKGKSYVRLSREEDFVGNEKYFLKADRDLREQIQRFIPNAHM